jgi:S1-C subfamily serine protease
MKLKVFIITTLFPFIAFSQDKTLVELINNSFKIICYKESKISHTGSGFILNKNKVSGNNYEYVCISNEHVLDNSDSVVIVSTKFNEKRYTLKHIVASIHNLDATIFTFETSDQFDGVVNSQNFKQILNQFPEIGTNIFTVSSPKGLLNSVSNGIVASNRKVNSKNLIQITAPISHGSSGGLVSDATGVPIGLIVSQLNEGQNLNFSVSLSDFHRIKEKSFL